MIRKIGFILLLAGFLWIVVDCVVLAPLVQHSRLEAKISALEEVTLTPETAAGALESLTLEHRSHLVRLMIPAAFMLVGGLTLAAIPRKKRKFVSPD